MIPCIVYKFHFWYLMVCFIFLLSCKKDGSDDAVLTGKEAMIHAWMDERKSALQPVKANFIEQLKKNLDTDQITTELLNSDEFFLIVPVNPAYARIMVPDTCTILLMLAVSGNEQKILRGSLIMFTPPNKSMAKQLPDGTFARIFNYRDIALDGVFHFMSLTGRLMYRLEYVNGKFDSYSMVRKIATSQANRCSEWYLVKKRYGDEELTEEPAILVGSSCEDCDDAGLPNFCPGLLELAETSTDCCIPGPDLQLLSDAISVPIGWECKPGYIDAVSGNKRKTCSYSWYYNYNLLAWSCWQYAAIEEAELEQRQGVWKIVKLKHVTETMKGNLPGCLTLRKQKPQVKTSLSHDSTRARVDIMYTTMADGSCSRDGPYPPVFGSTYKILAPP